MATSTGSSLVSRMLLALRAGFQFQGARDLYTVYGYSRILTEKDLYEKYKRQDVASSIIDKPAEALWTAPPKISQGPQELGDEWESFVHKHDLWSKLLRADKMLGMEKYVLLYLVMPGSPDKPAPRNGQVAAIHVFGGSTAAISTYNTDPSNPNFGMPETYKLKLAEHVTASPAMVVHSSRVIHLTNELLESNHLSEPRMVRGYNILEDILKVAGGSAETYWLTANRGTQVDVDKDMDLSQSDLDALSDEIDEYQHQLRRVLRTRGVKVTTLGSDVADPRGVFEVSVSLLASTYKIPQRIMMGAEAGQLASEQDRANWANAIQERRIAFAQPYVLLPILRKFAQMNVISQGNGEFSFIWPEAFKVSPLERAQTMAQTARAVVNLSRQIQFGNPMLTTEECREVLSYPPNSELPTVEEAMIWHREGEVVKSAGQQETKPEDEEEMTQEEEEEQQDKNTSTETDQQ